MPQKRETVLEKVNEISNNKNKETILEYHKYLISRDTSTNYQKDNIKLIYMFAKFLESKILSDVKDKEIVLVFLDTKRKGKEEDPEQKWITTWNDYLWRLKMFYRWLHNAKLRKNNYQREYDEVSNWITPDFVNIHKKKTKRLSPYNQTDIWDKEELLSVVKYEPYKRNKAILTLLWDFNARPHEITLMRIKNIRMREKYGEVPFEAKTGSGPILLTCSFPYVREWLNEQSFRNESNARSICNLKNGAPMKPNAIWDMMRQLRIRIKKLRKNQE